MSQNSLNLPIYLYALLNILMLLFNNCSTTTTSDATDAVVRNKRAGEWVPDAVVGGNRNSKQTKRRARNK